MLQARRGSRRLYFHALTRRFIIHGGIQNKTMTDQQCLDNIRLGGKPRADGISQLYRAYARRFLAYLLKHRVPREHAEELVQDVFINIVRHCDAFRGETRIDAWMWSIVRNALIDYVRRQRPEIATDDDDLIHLAGAAEDTASPEAGEIDECVRKAFTAFSAANGDRAQVLSLVAFEGWSIDDVAAMLKRTPGATREYLSQCRKKLKEFLQPCRQFLAG
jgi:RNA polymerase sigma-70 factor (ECF subfamily)